MNVRRWGALAMALATVACGADTAAQPSAAPTTIAPESIATTSTAAMVYGSVQVADQVGDGRQLAIGRVDLRGIAGFVVIHDEAQGGPHDVLGHVAAPEGLSKDLVVTFDQPLPPGPYWAMLHRDVSRVGVFEWPGPDGPVRAATGVRYAQQRLVLTIGPNQ